MSKIKNGGQYGTQPFEQQQFGTAGVEWLKWLQRKLEHCFIAIATFYTPRGTAQSTMLSGLYRHKPLNMAQSSHSRRLSLSGVYSPLVHCCICECLCLQSGRRPLRCRVALTSSICSQRHREVFRNIAVGHIACQPSGPHISLTLVVPCLDASC